MVLGGRGDLEGGVTCWLRSSISIQFAYMSIDTKGNTTGT